MFLSLSRWMHTFAMLQTLQPRVTGIYNCCVVHIWLQGVDVKLQGMSFNFPFYQIAKTKSVKSSDFNFFTLLSIIGTALNITCVSGLLLFYYYLTDTCRTGVHWSLTLPDRSQGAVVNISLSDEFYLTAVAEYAANELRCSLCRKQNQILMTLT